MKVSLFGATGKTGHHLIEEALKRQLDVTVFVRTETNFSDPRVRIVRGVLTDVEAIADAIHGADAVLSALGPTRVNHPHGMPIANAYAIIVNAMRREGVRRLIATSTPTAPDPGDKKFVFTVWAPAALIKLLLRASYDDMVEFPKVIRGSELDWTMVRLNLLKDRPATGKIYLGLCGRTKHTLTVSRQDVAIFMLDQITRHDWTRQAPAISNA